ncbi:MAG: hypothetical protein BEU04_03090 [Marine Group III euryarchaeote CG-Bathy1]|uniref:Carbamate kinase n=1 Tax=Marine Group III euryarchaeote CG-Bathy1 TaxID=1889001 RepID=A0A1J5TR05_9ARCH|nr:MAG: hypothetical protein BEU04_03090 [Marine Group III euryarchaeote CG-Bathy1]
MRIVLALGGNALLRPNDDGTVESELKRAKQSLQPIETLLSGREKILITHGNGPQVGNALLRVEASIPKTPPRPLDHLVSDTQGGLGYLLERTVRNLILKNNGSREVLAMLAQVEIDSDKDSFRNAIKPIGPYYSIENKAELERKGWFVKKTDRGLRRLVPSPKPKRVVELEIIRSLFENRVLVITAGGGGTPVVTTERGYEGVEGVIDKDSVASLLACELNATHLIIATDVDNVWVGKEKTPLEKITKDEIKLYYEKGEFPEGSMGPKVEAGIQFLERGGEMAIITSTEKISLALQGEAGTIITN